jgi:hypothetical protein
VQGQVLHSNSQTISVMMPKIVRKILGLADGSFSHLGIQAGSLVFSSGGEGGDVWLPVSMAGTFHSAILSNLFLYLAGNRQNGILTVSTGPLTKVVLFKDGEIVFGGTTEASERIGSVLVRLGFATQEQVDEIAAQDDTRRFGVRMKEARYITTEQLWTALRTQVVSICCSLVGFPVGTYFFLPECVPADSFTQFRFSPQEVLFESVLRMDERMREVDQAADAPLGVLSGLE